MKLLHIDAGITGEGSVSRQVSAAVVQAARDVIPNLEVVRRDVSAAPLAHLAGQHLGTDEGAEVLQEFLDADVIVIGAPMYNFTIPSQLKAWFDRILVAGKTFRYTETGPEGLAGGKKVIIASARGNLYAPGSPQAENDFHEPYLRAVFAFIGIDDITILRAEGVAFGPEQRRAALDAAFAAAPAVVAELRAALAA